MDAFLDGIEVVRVHGALLVLASCWFAWMFSIISVARCNFFRTDQGELGLFTRPYTDDESGKVLGCVQYSSRDALDATFVAAGAFSILSVLCISVAVISMSTAMVLKTAKRSLLWKTTQICLAFAAVAHVLTFIILGSEKCSESGCTLIGVGSLSVFNTMLLALLSFIFYFLPVPIKQRLEWWNELPKGNLALPAALSVADIGHSENDTAGEVSVSSLSSRGEQKDSMRSIQASKSFRVCTVAFIFLSWMLSILSVRRCAFLVGHFRWDVAGLGFYTLAVENSEGEFLGCVAFPENLANRLDGSYRIGKAFATLNVIVMAGVFVVAALQLFLRDIAPMAWYTMRGLLPAAMCFQLAAFKIFSTESCDPNEQTECKLGATSVIAILNAHCQLAQIVLVVLVPPPSNPVLASSNLTERDDTYRTNSDSSNRAQGPASSAAAIDARENQTARSNLQYLVDGESESYRDTYMEDTSLALSSAIAETESPPSLDSITVTIEYIGNEKHVTKTLTHADGSQTHKVTATVLSDDDSSHSSIE